MVTLMLFNKRTTCLINKNGGLLRQFYTYKCRYNVGRVLCVFVQVQVEVQ